MADQTLLLLLDDVRSKLLKRLEGVTAHQATWAPQGMQNHILWHAGHAAMVLERLTMDALGKPSQTPAGWFELFGWDSRPAAVETSEWPTLATVVGELEQQKTRMHDLISGLSEAQLAAPAANKPEHSVRFRIAHALHDEASHSGEIWLLRKIMNVASV